MKTLKTLIKRELLINYKSISNFLISIFFFIFSSIIFILAIGSDQNLIKEFGHSIIWSITLFTVILSTDQFFVDDHKDGSLKELQLIGYSTEIIMVSKVLVMWIFLILPILLLTPLLTLIMQIPKEEFYILLISITLGSPSLLLIGSVGALITVQSNKNKLILMTIIFPFYIPILIFGVSSNNMLKNAENYSTNFLILIAIFLITLPMTLVTSKIAMKELNK